MTETTIYHNPRCTKSRQTLELLHEKGIEPVVVEYLKTPPATFELDSILTKLGKEPRDIIRKNEAEYAESGAGRGELSRDELIHIMAEYPKLIERPIVVRGEKAAIGRPPENVLDIL